MTRATLLGALAAVAAAIWLLWPAETDEDRVVAHVRQLAGAGRVEAGAGPRIGADRAARLAAFFTPQASVDLGPPFVPAEGRDAVAAAAAALPVPDGGLDIELLAAEASVDRRLLLATATVTARASTADGGEVVGERTYAVAFRQRDGGWLVHDVRPAPAR